MSILYFVILLIFLLAVITGLYWALTRQKKTSFQSNSRQKTISDDLLGSSAASASLDPVVSSPTLPPLVTDGDRWRVLIIDDLPRWAEVVLDYGKILPCDIRHVTSLMAAAQALKTWNPQLILLDLHMPRDDWRPDETLRDKYLVDQKTLAFCEQVTNSPDTEGILVVIISVEKQEEEQQKALAAGAFRFYTKESFHLDDLKELLQMLQTQSSAKTP